MKNDDVKMKKLIIQFFNKITEGCDIYSHKESTWIIFTEEKKWVIELTGNGTLWYNYTFFKNKMSWFNLDVVEYQHYITYWVEYLIKNGIRETLRFPENKKVNDTALRNWGSPRPVETVIENGVKQTQRCSNVSNRLVEDTIQNGMKEIFTSVNTTDCEVEDAIENGVKEIKFTTSPFTNYVEDTIENGVKNTSALDGPFVYRVKDTIENGVKHTQTTGENRPEWVEDTIENGVKQTKRSYNSSRKQRTNYVIGNGIKEVKTDDSYRNYFKQNHKAEKVIENGVKETKTPGDGDIESTLEWIKENNTVNIPELINDVVENGIRSTNWFNSTRDMPVQETIEHGITKTEAAMRFDDGEEVEYVIENGINETKRLEHDRTTYHAHFSQEHGTHIPMNKVQDVIESGVTNTLYNRYLDEHNDTEEVINEGVKYTEVGRTQYNSVEDVIETGIKETKGGVHFFGETVENVIKDGTKNWEDECLVKFTEEPIVNETRPAYIRILNLYNTQPNIVEEKRYGEVDDVIKDGIKEVQPLPAQDGNKDWGIYYNRQEDRTKPFTRYVDDVIRDGVKETYDDIYHHKSRVEGVIKNGVKHTHSWDNTILGNPPRFENILKDIDEKN